MNNPIKKNIANFATIAAGLAMMGGNSPFMNDFSESKYMGKKIKDTSRDKELRKCALPSCNNETIYGYCSAEHCKQHKELQKLNKKKPLTN